MRMPAWHQYILRALTLPRWHWQRDVHAAGGLCKPQMLYVVLADRAVLTLASERYLLAFTS